MHQRPTNAGAESQLTAQSDDRISRIYRDISLWHHGEFCWLLTPHNLTLLAYQRESWREASLPQMLSEDWPAKSEAYPDLKPHLCHCREHSSWHESLTQARTNSRKVAESRVVKKRSTITNDDSSRSMISPASKDSAARCAFDGLRTAGCKTVRSGGDLPRKTLHKLDGEFP